MTVAAVVLAPERDEAHALVGGVAAIRRIADVAWAGGALPIVVVAEDEEAVLDIGTPLSGASGTVVIAARAGPGSLARLADGLEAARRQVEGTDAALIWPGGHVHLDAETATSLIEAHGAEPDLVLVPTYDGIPGWPILLPVRHAGWLASDNDALGDLAGVLRGAGVPTRLVELGDPGIVHDRSTAAEDLPPFVGPPEPVGSARPDWGDRIPAADPSPTPPPGAR